MAPPSPPSCLPVLVIFPSAAFSLHHTIPGPGQEQDDTDRRPPPRGGGEARGRLLRKGSEAVSPPPFLASSRSPRLPLRGAAHGWRREPQRCVCVCQGGAVPGPRCPRSCVLFQGRGGGLLPVMAHRGKVGRGHCPEGAATLSKGHPEPKGGAE
jgi:hypothetical protein